jgi:hypothetical protein
MGYRVRFVMANGQGSGVLSHGWVAGDFLSL